jgi:predicted alpha/beta hydrolase family esterase
MKRVIIVHGYAGHPEENWFPWLKSELEKEGIEAIVPRMPNTDTPEPQEWLPYLQNVIGEADADTYLVGHSLGCIVILRYLESLKDNTQVGGVILVSGFAEPIHLTELNKFFEPKLNDDRIRSVAKNILAINSDNDRHVPLWQGEKIAERFKARLIVLHDAGHINQGSGFKELPIVLAELQNMFEK